jgi:2-polyprenyl-6-hydroxyphenyl methylase/3-demethylubiquinone-9 3-methyltransferase
MKNLSSKAKTTINEAEISHFAQDSANWWNVDGPFAPLHRLTPTRMSYILDKIGTIQGKTILDIGCGGGLISCPLSRLGANVTGIDADQQAIRVAQEHAKAEKLNACFVNGAAEDLIYQKKKFDVVLALEVIEHVDNPNLFVELCSNLLKPNGMVIFSTLNRTWKSYALGIVAAEQILRWVPKGTHSWKKFIKPSELAEMCQSNNLVLRDATGIIFNPLKNQFALHPHDLDVNYFLVATHTKSR